MGSLVQVNDAAGFLASLAEAKRFLAACTSMDDIKVVRDKAKAVEVWARAQKDAGEVESAAGELRIRATLRMVELSPKATNEERARMGGLAKADTSACSKAEQAGIPRKEMHAARAMAAVPAPVREKIIEVARERRESPVPALVKAAKDEAKAARRAEVVVKAAAEATPDSGLYTDFAAIPRGRYRCIYLDPPWAYDDASCQGAAAEQYSTMGVEQLAALDVGSLAHPDGAHLWMWTTWPMIRDKAPHRLCDAWGFRWVGEVVWDKDRPMGLGRWLRVSTEVLVLAVRGTVPLLVDDQPGLLRVARAAHSVKPAQARAIVERCSPGPRLEVFARQVPAGWDAFGNEVERSR